jgi:hypothetical protein
LASLQQLNDDVGSYLNRRDYQTPFPGWVTAVETELSETLRSKFQIASGIQALDAPYITLPPNFATMESIRDATTGVILDLKDSWSGSWTDPQQDDRNTNVIWYNPTPPACTAYRILANCIEFLPHPVIPDPPDPSWTPQVVLMNWYTRPTPLLLPSDTNPILENLYEVYLWGIIKRGALWALDPDRASQADAEYQQAVTRGNLWTQQSVYSGAPFRAEMAVQFG